MENLFNIILERLFAWEAASKESFEEIVAEVNDFIYRDDKYQIFEVLTDGLEVEGYNEDELRGFCKAVCEHWLDNHL